MELVLLVSLESLPRIPRECKAATWKCFHHYSGQHWPLQVAQLKLPATFTIAVFQWRRQRAGCSHAQAELLCASCRTIGWSWCWEQDGEDSWKESRDRRNLGKRGGHREWGMKELALGFFKLAPLLSFPKHGPSVPFSITYWEKGHMEHDSPSRARLPTPGIWWFFSKRNLKWKYLQCFLSAKLIYHSFSLTFFALSQWIQRAFFTLQKQFLMDLNFRSLVLQKPEYSMESYAA